MCYAGYNLDYIAAITYELNYGKRISSGNYLDAKFSHIPYCFTHICIRTNNYNTDNGAQLFENEYKPRKRISVH